MNIRPAKMDDSSRIAPLSSELGYPATEEQIRARLAGILPHPENAVFVAVDSSRVVIGWVQVQVRHSLMADDFAEVVGLVVDHRYRGKGVGRALMDEAERWAGDKGLSRLRLRSRVHREEAHRFYENIGYHSVKVQKVLDKDL